MNAPGRYENIRLKPTESRVTVVADPKVPNSSIFYLAKEDHTLGNALRMSLLRDPRVRFAGYRMTHPLEYVCEIKVQTADPEILPIETLIYSLELVNEEFMNIEAQFRAHFKKDPAGVPSD